MTSFDLTSFDLDAWCRKYGEAVHFRALRIVRDSALAWDVVQESFLRAHRYRSTWRNEGSPLAWLFTISDRVAFDVVAKRKREVVGDEDVSTALGEVESAFLQQQSYTQLQVEGRLQQDQLLRQALRHADAEVQQILVFRFVDELSVPDIALRLRTSERTVRRRLEGFFARTRKHFAKEEHLA